jgi:membrane fusion protein (multidrug efflux system)
MLAAVLVLVLVLAGVKGYFIYRTIQGFKAQGVPKYTVSATKVEWTLWQSTQTAVASLHAVHGADLSPEVAGIVVAIDFNSGQDVRAGQLLVRLRATDDLAHLQSLKAIASLDQILHTRDKAQLEAQAVSQAIVDNDAANLNSAQAQVNEQQAVVDKKFIRAPFDGRVGIRAIDPGQYVAAGTKLVTLQALDPIYADFYLPQQNLAQLTVGGSVTVSTNAAPGQSFPGRIEAINPQVDTNTRNVQLRARLANAKHRLLPGMFVNVSVELGAARRYLTLPQSAIVYNPYGTSVFVVKPAGAGAKGSSPSAAPAAALTVQQQFIETGPTRGDQVAIVKGLHEQDLVVTSGQLKLRNGAMVTIDNSVTPADNPNPNPPNE